MILHKIRKYSLFLSVLVVIFYITFNLLKPNHRNTVRQSMQLQYSPGKYDPKQSNIPEFTGVVPSRHEQLYTPQKYNYSGPKLKKILLVTQNIFGEGQLPFTLAACKYDACFLTADENQFKSTELDAVFLSHVHTPKKPFPMPRSRHTRYIFYDREAGWHSSTKAIKSNYDDVFNWTMMFRNDADIPTPYGRIWKKREGAESPYDLPYEEDFNYAMNKSKIAAWFVSRCTSPSHREDYVKILQKYIKVDVFGNCSPQKCSTRALRGRECYEMVGDEYKFYLSFENAVCKDYVTEKLFYILKYNVVPVVYGGANYENVAPPYSYINVMDYKGPKELAAYLKYLDENDDAYNEYFKWKKDHLYMINWVSAELSLCHLCEKLHTDKTEKVYKSMYEWYSEGQCYNENQMKTLMKYW